MTDRNPDLGFTAIDSIHGIRTNIKANSFYKSFIIIVCLFNYKPWLFFRPIQREFPPSQPMWD